MSGLTWLSRVLGNLNPCQNRGMREPRLLALVCLIAFAVSVVLVFAWPAIADPDSFYHFAHARIYLDRRSFDQSFPWTEFSATGALDADLWFGLHLFALPFASIPDPIVGLKLAIAVWLATSATIMFFAIYRLQPQLAWAMPLLVCLSGGLETGRLLALRPQSLSMALLLFAISLLVRPSRPWTAIVVGFAFAFFHQTLSWLLVPAVFCGLIMSYLVLRQRSSFVVAALLVFGLLLGWLLRPGAMDAIALMRVQIVDLAAARSGGVPLPFGTEVYKLTTSELIQGFPVFAAVWVAGLIVGVILLLKRRSDLDRETLALFAITSVLSLVFYELLLVGSARGLEYWVVTSSSSILSGLLMLGTAVPKLTSRWVQGWAAIVILATAIPALVTVDRFMNTAAIDPSRFRPAMQAIAQRSGDGELVWTAQWELFPELLFWNRKNHYVQGMDPIFLYSADPKKFWQIQYLRDRKTSAQTFDGPPSSGANSRSTHDVLAHDFKAEWALIIKPATPELAAYMTADSGYETVYEDAVVVVFRVLDGK